MASEVVVGTGVKVADCDGVEDAPNVVEGDGYCLGQSVDDREHGGVLTKGVLSTSFVISFKDLSRVVMHS